REVIFERVWGIESEVTSNAVEAYVKNLRKKIDPPNQTVLVIQSKNEISLFQQISKRLTSRNCFIVLHLLRPKE
ncbi:winged helix-turn-helix domain-containing protein, partial [Gottfriedia acidiceleris]|uniref:winged helix-turn-helix domain-containing protein n=1 Tax=Gottfriedia acidiceleris TaxID=371036 RepID=UPI0033962234